MSSNSCLSQADKIWRLFENLSVRLYSRQIAYAQVSSRLWASREKMTKDSGKKLGDLLAMELQQPRGSLEPQTNQPSAFLLHDAHVGAFLRQNGVKVKLNDGSPEITLAEIASQARKASLRLIGKKGGRPRGRPSKGSKLPWIDEVWWMAVHYQIVGKKKRAAAIRDAIKTLNPKDVQGLRGTRHREKIRELQKIVENQMDAERRRSAADGGIPGLIGRFASEKLSE